MKTVAIVGMGHVGAATAFNLGINNTVAKIVCLGNTKDKVVGQVRDLEDGFTLAGSKTKVVVGDYSKLEDVDIVVITASATLKRGQSRLDAFADNKLVMENIVEKCNAGGFKGIYIIASNPVDVMTAVVHKHSGFETNKVIGSGTILDNVRFKLELSKELNIDYKFIECNAIGEHGASIDLLFSTTKINGQFLEEYLEQNSIVISHDKIIETVIRKGPEIHKAKGTTEFGIAISISKIVEAIVNDSHSQLLVTNYDSRYNLFIPNLFKIGKEGVVSRQPIALSKFEVDIYEKSVSVLKQYQDKL